MAADKIDENDIDYMHPNGKLEMSPEDAVAEANESIEEKLEDVRTTQQSIDEADGHHVCSSTCQLHHNVVTKSAFKTP